MLNNKESLIIKAQNQIKILIQKILLGEKQKERFITNESYLILVKETKYFIWISKNLLDNKACIYIFTKDFLQEEWITIKDEYVNWIENEYLLEGYLVDNEMYFSDILYPIYNINYENRRSVMKKIFINSKSRTNYVIQDRGPFNIILGKICNYIRLSENPKDDNFLKNLMKRNFKDGKVNFHEEYINNNKIVKTRIDLEKKEILPKTFRLKKGSKIELYELYELETNNYIGYLYIKTLKESKYIKEYLNNDIETIKVNCEWNDFLQAWQFKNF